MEWKPLIYHGEYLGDTHEISNNGVLRNAKTKKELKLYLNKEGYLMVAISRGRKRKIAIRIHRAVAENFVDGFSKGLEVNHIDGNKKNNNSENLEWVTRSENQIHAVKMDLNKNHIKIKCLNTGEIFNSVKDACEWCGLSQWSRSMTEYLYNKKNRKSAGKHPITKEPLQWELVD